MKQTYLDGQYMKTKYLKIREKNGENGYGGGYGNHRTSAGLGSTDERHIAAPFAIGLSNIKNFYKLYLFDNSLIKFMSSEVTFFGQS